MEHEELAERVGILEVQVDGLVKAFPGADIDGHRRYHQALIDEIEDRRKLRRAVIEKLASGGAWAALVFIALAVWQYAKDHLK